MARGSLNRLDNRKDFYLEVQKGNVPGHSIIHKFGRNIAVPTTFVTIALGGVYNTPQVGSATTLRVKAGNTNDTAAGSGAREITVIGLDETATEVTEVLATAGTSASTATTATFIRLFRAYVSKSGTYATSAAGSHAADVVIENGAGGTDWATIAVADYPRSQTEIGVYSVATGKTAYLLNAAAFTDTNKITELILFKRESILQTAAPYDGMRILLDLTSNLGGEETFEPRSPIVVVGPADLGFMAKVSATTAEVDVDFEVLVVDN